MLCITRRVWSGVSVALGITPVKVESGGQDPCCEMGDNGAPGEMSAICSLTISRSHGSATMIFA